MDHWSQEFETSLGNMAKPCIYTHTHAHTHTHTHTQISWASWHIPVVPATWESELGGLLESREVEATVSWDPATALQPGQHSKTLSPKKEKKERKECVDNLRSHLKELGK